MASAILGAENIQFHDGIALIFSS